MSTPEAAIDTFARPDYALVPRPAIGEPTFEIVFVGAGGYAYVFTFGWDERESDEPIRPQ